MQTNLLEEYQRLQTGESTRAVAYLQAHGPISTREDLRGHTFISYIDDLLFSKEL